MVGAELQVEKNRERRTGAEMGGLPGTGENLQTRALCAATWVGTMLLVTGSPTGLGG